MNNETVMMWIVGLAMHGARAVIVYLCHVNGYYPGA